MQASKSAHAYVSFALAICIWELAMPSYNKKKSASKNGNLNMYFSMTTGQTASARVRVTHYRAVGLFVSISVSKNRNVLSVLLVLYFLFAKMFFKCTPSHFSVFKYL